MDCLEDLRRSGFQVRGIVADNHSSNVAAFKILLNNNPGDKQHYFIPPNTESKTYVFFDTVHLIKNIRNNLLHCKKFVFPGFEFQVCGLEISSEPGFISWNDLHKVHQKDQKLDANLRKAPKLSYTALHPADKKQNVGLALALFHDTTIAACRSYFPERCDLASFLELIGTWWIISNSNNKYNSNSLGNAIKPHDDKLIFLSKFADYIEEWQKHSHFCLSKQTAKALTTTLRSHAMLMRDLHSEGYLYVMTRRLQSDPIENRFSQYRQMSGGRFLVSLREMQSSQRILTCRSLLKTGVDIWDFCDENQEDELFKQFMCELADRENEIMEASLCKDSEEVARFIAGYAARNILQKTKCEECCSKMIPERENEAHGYLEILSRGGLIQPSAALSYATANCFALVDCISEKLPSSSVRAFCKQALEKYAPQIESSCETHIDSNRKAVIRIVVNIYFNRKQKLAGDSVRKQQVIGFKKRQRNRE